jgi:hypothetical protein
VRLRLADGALERGPIARERLHDIDVVAERDDRTAVGVAQRFEEADCRVVDGLDLVGHARAGIDQEDEIDRHFVRFEELDVLKNAVLVDRKVVLDEAGHEPLAIADGDVQRDQAGAAPEDPALRRLVR